MDSSTTTRKEKEEKKKKKKTRNTLLKMKKKREKKKKKKCKLILPYTAGMGVPQWACWSCLGCRVQKKSIVIFFIT